MKKRRSTLSAFGERLRTKTSKFLKEAKAALNYRVVLLQVPDDLLPKVTAGFNHFLALQARDS
ncbi:hypothetical protein CHH90_21850 [Bacillus licheniformis]|nr:hypothetical protein CJO35_04705 [Bacillus sp. 1s-1]ATI75155.1 hypothetical protein CPQ91_04670 [Bacillus licheniformis]EQM29112.1 hypothetical protein N399_04925 [Bacillus licheniformis CG-B52]MBY8349443.1 hypothetical protein [Bacillus sp. PCH94]AUZ29618.1 hypothetical protein C1T27_04490 [Bacillus licheniformis]